MFIIDHEEIISYLKSLNWSIHTIQGQQDHKQYAWIRDYEIQLGGLQNKKCDIAFEHVTNIPYVFPSAIHTRPHLLPMSTQDRTIATQKSPIGPEWQYWSRRLDKPHTPKNIVTHIATIFRDVKLDK